MHRKDVVSVICTEHNQFRVHQHLVKDDSTFIEVTEKKVLRTSSVVYLTFYSIVYRLNLTPENGFFIFRLNSIDSSPFTITS